ncbi:hypothetical protein [Achromobacter arsenitoxydans]|uniref:EAL domain-containing protein n=1 Tax=Achromobacter arsenitoxydans SY8 TaxID=477184 RepID=H0F801_9BURK|nr:hypothetical protein [Achromobacter arsenitoxydans]EHK65434.1 hypothetical protein KYC_14497 [Achromobacter arsenitoxydans SY8]
MNAIYSGETAKLLSEPLRIQPVLDATGAVREMALVGGWMNRAPTGLTNHASADALRMAGSMFRAAGCMAPLTMDHQLDVYSEVRLPEQLCHDLRIGAVEGDLLHEISNESDRTLPIYPCAKVIYNVPLSDRLVEGASLFQLYREFRPALRVRLLPSSASGEDMQFGAIRGVGIRVAVPDGISRNRTLQERFFCLLGHASRKGLKVLACDITVIEDFNWLRAQPDVLFQGEALSIALSIEYVQDWISGAGSDWRAFHLGA